MFEYEPLDSTTHSIRLLHIHSGNDDDPIRLSIRHAELGEGHTCLSYAWGTEHSQKQIFVNDQLMMVRQNLWNFLRTARRYRYKHPIWIDAICINQQDIEEKNHQVRFMSSIYNDAVLVVVWLGLSDVQCNTLLGLQCLLLGGRLLRKLDDHRLTSAWGALCRDHDWLDKEEDERAQFLRVDFHDPETYDGYPREFSTWVGQLVRSNALKKMATADYWTRAWIIQEILLADNVVMISPVHLINLQSLLPFIEQHIFRYHEHRYRDYFSTLPLMKSRTPSEPEHRGSMPFEDILNISRSRQCGDVRDRIYSVLSLTSGGDQFKVDYGSSKEQVLWETVNFQWQHDMNGKKGTETDIEELIHTLGRIAQHAFAALRLEPPTFNSIKHLEQPRGLLAGNKMLENRSYWTAPHKSSSARHRSYISLCIPLSTTTTAMVIEWPLIRDHNCEPLGWKLSTADAEWWTSSSYMRIQDRAFASANPAKSSLGRLQMKMHRWERHQLNNNPATSSSATRAAMTPESSQPELETQGTEAQRND